MERIWSLASFNLLTNEVKFTTALKNFINNCMNKTCENLARLDFVSKKVLTATQQFSFIFCRQDGVYFSPAGGTGEGFQRGSLSRCLCARNAGHEDRTPWGQDTGMHVRYLFIKKQWQIMLTKNYISERI